MGEKVIKLRHLKKIYRMGDEKIAAVNDVSLDFERGEISCLLGKSGSGKSTLLNLISGLEKPTKGEIIILGKHIERMDENQLASFRQKNIGFVFQSYNLLSTLTALENVMLPMVFVKTPLKERKLRAMEMLKKVGLENRANHKPNQLSGGQQQRVSIGRALINNPALMLADEPTGNLDSENSKEIVSLLRQFNKELNQTVIIITHDEKIALSADRIISIEDGKITRDEVRNR